MKIPRKFKLAGITWSVIEVPRLDNLGLTDRDTATIMLRKGLPRQVAEATFCHELQHAILFTMGVVDDHDEVDIDLRGRLLHQFLNSAR